MQNPTLGGHQGPPLGACFNPPSLALSLAEAGFSCIPCIGKKAVVPWVEFQKRPACADEVQGWWRQHPKANAAILCGEVNALTVVDVDGCGHALDVLPRLLEMFGPTPLAVITPGKGGGYQLYYGYVPGVKGKWSLMGFEGDIRGDGGYVMTPGSLHPDVPAVYRTDVNVEGYVRLLGNLPAGNMETLLKATEKPNGFARGNRNNHLFSQAIEQAASAPSLNALQMNVTSYNLAQADPLPDDEVGRVVKSAWSYKQRGTLLVKGERHALVKQEEWARLSPNELYLLVLLKMCHSHREEFAIGLLAVSKLLRWSKHRLSAAIRGLLSEKVIHLRYKGGKGKRDPSQYGWGAGFDPNITDMEGERGIGIKNGTLTRAR